MILPRAAMKTSFSRQLAERRAAWLFQFCYGRGTPLQASQKGTSWEFGHPNLRHARFSAKWTKQRCGKGPLCNGSLERVCQPLSSTVLACWIYAKPIFLCPFKATLYTVNNCGTKPKEHGNLPSGNLSISNPFGSCESSSTETLQDTDSFTTTNSKLPAARYAHAPAVSPSVMFTAGFRVTRADTI